MIISRAPLRISFVGGGTDLPDFYCQYPGRVLSVSIDKFIYVLVNHIPHTKKVIVKYRTTESVDHPSQLEHTRVKAALFNLGILRDIEIGSFADISAKAGLGSSSSFSVALLKSLNAFLGKSLSKQETAEAACRLEIELLREPIGKQDQYAAAFGGFNIFHFNRNGTVGVKPVLLSHQIKRALQDHLLLFFSGITRNASDILAEQKNKISQEDNFNTLRKMSDSVLEFERYLEEGNFKKIGEMLNDAWQMKRSLASKISNNLFDSIYQTGIETGAWGGKILGAGGGGCFLFLTPPEKKENIKKALIDLTKEKEMNGFEEIPFKFTECGVDLVYRDDR